MKVAIRTDASLEIGTGHVMRCLTLAEELKAKGAEVLFICRDLPGNMAAYIHAKAYETFLLPLPDKSGILSEGDGLSAHQNWLGLSQEQDAEETTQVLLGRHYDWLVVDHYAIDKTWETKLRDIVKNILVIDDLADRIHSCDILLDQNYYADMGSRYTNRVPSDCRKLLGPRYALLRKEFRDARKSLRERDGTIKKIFIFFGGVDLHNMTGIALQAVMAVKSDDIAIDVVIGEANPHREAIEEICSSAKNIQLHIQVHNMAQMMADADLCIGSGGTVTWERCCLGLPALAWPVADNQQELLSDGAQSGLVYVPDVEVPAVDEISIHIKALLHNASICSHLSEQGLKLIDGKGAIRVANLMATSDVGLRPVDQDDMQKIFEWRNDASVRRYSRNPEKIELDQHQQWFEKTLADPDRELLIANHGSEDVGVLRFDIAGDQAEISIYLVPGQHGQGYGVALIDVGEQWLKNCRPEVTGVIAEVLPENKASKKIFEMCGYTENAIQYRKSIN